MCVEERGERGERKAERGEDVGGGEWGVEVKGCVGRFWYKGYEIMELEECGLQTAISLRVSSRIPPISLREHALQSRECAIRERESSAKWGGGGGKEVYGIASCAY